MKKLLLCVLLCVLTCVGLGVAAFYFKFPFELWDQLLPVTYGEPVFVTIRPGINAKRAAQDFYDQGALTDSPKELALWMVRFGLDRKFRPGQYRVNKATGWDLARQLRTIQPISSSLTIIPGADIFSLRDMFAADELKAALLSDDNYPVMMRPYLPSKEEERIAFLLPETYFVVEKKPTELVQTAAKAWWESYGHDIPVDTTSEDVRRLATIASMVQREALWDSERSMIAGVIENRLEKNMLLQIDATVVYAWKTQGRTLTRVLYDDLAVKSPYNTYVVQGLPPTPICIPSAESWEAVFAPEKHGYYYYVAAKDGHHYFAGTYDEHRTNIKKARQE